MILQRVCHQTSDLLVTLERFDFGLMIAKSEHLTVVLEILAVDAARFGSAQPAFVFVALFNFETSRILFVSVGGREDDCVWFEQGPNI